MGEFLGSGFFNHLEKENNMRRKKIGSWVLSLSLVSLLCFAGESKKAGEKKEKRVLTYKDVAPVLVKQSGYFKRYVPANADDKWCIDFLGKLGVQLYLEKDLAKNEFTKKDMARVLGQIELRLNGEAVYSNGMIQRPKDVASWEEFCRMNAIEYKHTYITLRETLF